MTNREFLLPDVGEGLTEAEIVRWRVQVGDTVQVNDPVVDIETAKAVVELPCPFSGVISELLVAEGHVVPVGSAILSVTTDEREPVLIGYGVMSDVPQSTARVLAKPPVRRLARELGVDLQTIPPSGAHGDVTRDDVHRAVADDVAMSTPVTGDRIAVRGVQRTMAQAMVRSVTQAPQVSIWKDVDVSASVSMLAAMRERPDFADLRVTMLTLVIAAMVQGVRRCPELNARWHELGNGEAEIELRKEVNVGVAVAGPRGLVVPVLRDADRSTPQQIAQGLADLTARAREDQLTPQDSMGATITVTNIGVLDIDGGTAMLPPDQSGIVATGRIMDRPWVVNGGLAVRPIMQVSTTFDHRIVDGATGAKFLTEVANFLAEPVGDLHGD
jgi:2-oxoisovalerate dehydrogenase E2 component (dihydrolipoyl transacylase)